MTHSIRTHLTLEPEAFSSGKADESSRGALEVSRTLCVVD